MSRFEVILLLKGNKNHNYTTVLLSPNKEQKMNKEITWKIVPIETTSEDGVLLKGELKYWAKDYCVTLKEPFEGGSCGAHLQYGIPAKYVIEKSHKKGIIEINILEVAKKVLVNLYKNHNNIT